MEIKYVRCPNCSFIYTESSKKCPKCGAKQPINEDKNNSEPVFNIVDGI